MKIKLKWRNILAALVFIVAVAAVNGVLQLHIGCWMSLFGFVFGCYGGAKRWWWE